MTDISAFQDKRNLKAAISDLSADTGRTLAVAKAVGAVERHILLGVLRRQNIARWAVVVHRLSQDPAYADEFLDSDVKQARSLAHDLAVEQQAA